MRDILLALALTWCLWLTYDLYHNHKQDKRSNVVDKLTLKILKIHNRRLDYIDSVLGVDSEKGKIMNGCIIQHPETKKYAYFDVIENDIISGWLDEEAIKAWTKDKPLKTAKYMTYENALSHIQKTHGDKRAKEVRKGV